MLYQAQLATALAHLLRLDRPRRGLDWHLRWAAFAEWSSQQPTARRNPAGPERCRPTRCAHPRVHTGVRRLPDDGPVPRLRRVERHLRVIHAPFGPLSDFAVGGPRAHLDSCAARRAYHHALRDRIRGPRPVIGGETSDILLPETVEHVQASGATASEVPVTGYAPTLLDLLQIEAVARSFPSG